MRKKVTWVVVSGWMVAALLLTSCAPAVVEEQPEKVAPKQEVPKEKEVPKEEVVVVPEEKADMVKWTGTKLDGTVVEKMIERPRYGGIHITTGPVQPNTFDDITSHGARNWAAVPQEGLLTRDWLRGPVGTGEWSALLAKNPTPDTIQAGMLAESWDFSEPDTLKYKIRKGIHFALDPTSEASRLVGGREFTAADMVYNSIREWTYGYLKSNFGELADMENPANSIYISPDDPWTVILKSKPGLAGRVHFFADTGRNKMFAPEVIEKYGEIVDWHNVVGTGPFILKSYVTASSLTYERNPNYWMYDPFFPENQLPYVDGFKFLIIPDLSTTMAALRTGKIDNLPTNAMGTTIEITQEMGEQLIKTNPELQYTSFLASGGGVINMRNDIEPFSDIRVRQALAMGLNNPEILELYYDGKAEMFTMPIQPPVVPYIENEGLYIPLEDTSELVQELYGYNPDKARQLLAEAGYPDGFQTSIITRGSYVDLLSIVKEYWAKIGVELEIDVKDNATWLTVGRRKTMTQMYMYPATAGPTMLFSSYRRKGGGSNYSIVDSPWHAHAYNRLIEEYFSPDRFKVMTEPLSPDLPSWVVYANEQAWNIPLPVPYIYEFWQPWLKNYVGHTISYGQNLEWSKFVWIDQELKESMGR